MMEVNVCVGTSCHLNGSYNVVQILQQLIEENMLHDKIELKALFCMKQCNKKGVSVSVCGESYRIEPEGVKTFFDNTILRQMK
ncbi:MAG: hypothetical protein K0S76_1732 [Herbinix sp.]|jgi:NADH:ubiquinone oxidoreductase subunit E|nr:hypothetical protein [Herbinix sp.]